MHGVAALNIAGQSTLTAAVAEGENGRAPSNRIGEQTGRRSNLTCPRAGPSGAVHPPSVAGPSWQEALRAGVVECCDDQQPKSPLDGFSVERLMTFLTALDQDVKIVIRDKPHSRAAGRISVVGGDGLKAHGGETGETAGGYVPQADAV